MEKCTTRPQECEYFRFFQVAFEDFKKEIENRGWQIHGYDGDLNRGKYYLFHQWDVEPIGGIDDGWFIVKEKHEDWATYSPDDFHKKFYVANRCYRAITEKGEIDFCEGKYRVWDETWSVMLYYGDDIEKAKEVHRNHLNSLRCIDEKEFDRMCDFAEAEVILWPTLRFGQALFNNLAVYHPEISEVIRGTELDMFHQDKNIEKFKEKFVK